jgi:hypothetical protein
VHDISEEQLVQLLRFFLALDWPLATEYERASLEDSNGQKRVDNNEAMNVGCGTTGSGLQPLPKALQRVLCLVVSRVRPTFWLMAAIRKSLS